MTVTSEILPRVILSADDDEDAHILLRHAFVKAGIKANLQQVNDGSDAIQYLAGEGQFADRSRFPIPELLLLDLKMPTSGFRVLEHLVEHPERRVCPVIVLSSSTQASDKEKAQQLECDAYRVKPCNFNELLNFVNEIGRGFSFGPVEKKSVTQGSKPDSSINKPMNKPSVTTHEQNQPAAEGYDSPDIFRLLVEQVKDYAIFLLDTNGIVRSWNEGARRIKGYEPGEIIGKHFSIFYPKSDLDVDKPAYELRRAQEMGRYEEEGWRVRKDKSRFWAHATITPLRDPDGRLRGYTKVTRDLTQAKLQEESFQRALDSEERFRLLVEQVRDYAIFMLDARGHVISWNQGAKRIKDYTADEIIGKHFSIFYTDEALAKDHPAKELALAIRDGRYEEEGWRKRKDGTRLWANVVITALWDKRGNLTGFAKVTRDLTQKKIDEDALRRKNEALEAFAHTLSHDLRSPVRSISNFAEILEGEGAEQLSESDKASYFKKIKIAAESMNTMITEILNLSQVNTAPAPHETVSLRDIFNEVTRMLETEIKSSRAEVQIKEPLPDVIGNRMLLIQIFSNLLTNAFKFAMPGQKPKVEVFGVNQNGLCDIHVRDHGIGIAEESKEKIFQPFERGGVGRNIAGMGVGLAIVRRAAERIEGSVMVQSQVGEGSDFVVRVHCATEKNVPAKNI